MEELFAVSTGIIAGIITGVVPGAGVTVAMIIATPLLFDFSVLQLLLFYMALASMVQFTGTIPAVLLGVPGETNSLPAVIEGTKFTKHGYSQLAVGVSALGSVLGSIVSVCLTFALISLLISHMSMFFGNNTKFYLYIFVITFCVIVYNKNNILLNIFLCVLGFALSLPGESDISPDIRYTFGITDLDYGVPLISVLLGFLVVPTLYNLYGNTHTTSLFPNKPIKFAKVVTLFIKHIPSSIRGSVIGYLCGFVPGVSTVLSTNVSYSVEKKLHPYNPGKQLVASETANNSGQFASMLPLLLIGIPITGSEVVLYSLLIDAGWSPFQFNNTEQNADLIFQQLVPWFVFVNVCGLCVAWPFAKKIVQLLTVKKNYVIFLLLLGMILLNTYMGIQDYRLGLYTCCLFVFGCVGLLLRKHEPVPLIFLFILGNDIEGVFIRQMLI